MQRFGVSETHNVLIEAFISIAICDESAALSIVQMPFLNNAGVGSVFEQSDRMILEGLARVAQSKRGALEELLSLPELQGGITDPLTASTLLLILEREDPAAAAAIRDLPWIADGITYVDYSQPKADYINDETSHVVVFVNLVRRANKSFWAYLEIPWVRDGIQWTEYDVAINLGNLALLDDESARIFKMPFLETLEGDEGRLIYFLDTVAFRRGLPQLLSSPKLKDGIRDGQLGIVALVELEIRDPEAAAALNNLDWLKDGVDPSEQDAVHIMVRAFTESEAVFRALLAKSWVQDGLTQNESRVVGSITYMATYRANEAMALRILEMPFLQDVTSLDYLAVNSLNTLDEGARQRVLSHPELRNGITDEWTALVAVTHSARRSPDLLNALLDPEQPPVERGALTLPLAGEVTLSVIEPEGFAAVSFVQPGAGAWEPMDMLEHVMLTHEEFVGLPFPESHMLLFIADVSRRGGAHYGSGYIASESRSNVYIITHEAAHVWDMTPVWLAREAVWIIEGAAEFLTFVSERARTGSPLPSPRDSCSLANSIAEVVRLKLSSDEIYQSACNYILGAAMFLNLYNTLGDAAFRQGFSNLHLASKEKTAAQYPVDECASIDAALCYFKAAFLAGMTPEKSVVAEEIIDRRYYGSSR